MIAAELVAKARPAQLNYASNGVGSSTHLATEMFVMMAGIRMVHVPYKGVSAAASDLLSGQVQVMFSSAVAMMPQVKAGRLRAIAMTGAKRSAAIPTCRLSPRRVCPVTKRDCRTGRGMARQAGKTPRCTEK